jgi:FMN phosphatase YigB (HAD superfamily)
MCAGNARDHAGAALRLISPGFSKAMNPARLKAIVFDVDGTLYRQEPVRRAMFGRLLRAHADRPLTGLRTLRWLQAYRKAQERLRGEPADGSDLAERQVGLACKWTGAAPAELRSCVRRWMEEEPLGLLRPSVREGLPALMAAASRRALRLGACSDYPAAEKLDAMGLAGFFEVVVTAQDAEVQRFKPNPRILEVALCRLGVSKEETLYVGDRPEVDAEAARRAGVACAIIGRRHRTAVRPGWFSLPSFGRLVEFIR